MILFAMWPMAGKAVLRMGGTPEANTTACIQVAVECLAFSIHLEVLGQLQDHAEGVDPEEQESS